MPSFGTKSLSHLTTCHPDLQAVFTIAVKTFDCSVICGHRSEIAQQEAFESGNSKKQYPDSTHNSYPSMGADVPPYPIDWDDTARFTRFAFFVIGIAEALYYQGLISHRVRWGGDWDMDTEVKDNKFNDLAHFELVKS